jgi:hypothetical protein
MANYLDGKYVLYAGRESYRTGQVKATTVTGAFIQFDRMSSGTAKDDWSWPIEFVPFDELATLEDAGYRAWGFFESREALDAYLAYTDAPPPDDGERVVKLVPRGPRK